jgi:hypothetical protein
LQEAAGNNETWSNSYEEWWKQNALGNVFNKMVGLGYPLTIEPQGGQIQWQNENRDKLVEWHKQATEYANTANSTQKTLDFFQQRIIV